MNCTFNEFCFVDGTPKENTPKSFFRTRASRCQNTSLFHTPKTVPIVSGVEKHFGCDISEPSPKQTTTDQIRMGQDVVLIHNILKNEKMDKDLTDNQTIGTNDSTKAIGSAILKQERIK